MKLDPKSRAVTSFFMVIAVIVMLALAWSVSQDESNLSLTQQPQAEGLFQE
jgi:hypothetical protein